MTDPDHPPEWCAAIEAADAQDVAEERERDLLAVLDEAWRLLRIAEVACLRAYAGQGSNIRLSHEERMFALAFSPEERSGPGEWQVQGSGEARGWFKAAYAVREVGR